MERAFTVITETPNATIHSPFRFTMAKAADLAMHMDRFTNTDCHYPIEVEHDSELIPFEDCWYVYDVDRYVEKAGT